MSIWMWMALLGGAMIGVGWSMGGNPGRFQRTGRRLFFLGLFFAVGGVGMLFIPGGQDDERPVTQAELSVEAKTRAAELMPLLERHLPGLQKYRNSLTLADVYTMAYFPSQESGLPKETSVTWLEFVVPNNDTGIPNKYRANGHHLFVGVEKLNTALILKKVQTCEVMLDRTAISAADKDLVIPLR